MITIEIAIGVSYSACVRKWVLWVRLIVRFEYVWGGDCLIVKLSLWCARCEYVRKVWEKKILNVLHVIDLCPIAR